VIRRQLVGAALSLVVVAVIGLLYLQTIAQSRATRDAWMLTHDVSAGSVLGEGDVKRVRVPAAGDQFVLLAASPLHRRAAHRMRAQTLLTDDDLLDADTVQVPVSLRIAPGVAEGDTLDVVGRRLVVAGAGSPTTLLVAAADEPNWVALEANNVSLFAAKSTGVGVPPNPAVAVGDAISSLSGTSQSGAVLAGSGPPTAPATPPAPTPRPSPR